MPDQRQQRTQDPPPVAGVTARECAEGTGMSLSSVYRALRSLQDMGLIIRIPGSAGGRPRKQTPAVRGNK